MMGFVSDTGHRQRREQPRDVSVDVRGDRAEVFAKDRQQAREAGEPGA
jgi:general stress protein YciG